MALRAGSTFTLRQPTPAVDLAPKLGQRAMYIGGTGSGKTTAILRTLPKYYGRRQIIIADTKNDPAIESLAGNVVERLRDMPKATRGRYTDVQGRKYDWPPLVIYRPNGAELSDLRILDALCDWIYRRQRTVFVIDELGQFASQARAGPGLTNIFARGRTAEITTLGGTQRPKNVPIIAFTESELFFCFRLKFLSDRKRVSEYTDPTMIDPVISPYGVKMYRTGAQEPVEYVSLT